MGAWSQNPGVRRRREWRGAALERSQERPRGIWLGACMTANFVKQAAPANVSTRDRFCRQVTRMDSIRSGIAGGIPRSVIPFYREE
jgi:hypothetical protein